MSRFWPSLRKAVYLTVLVVLLLLLLRQGVAPWVSLTAHTGTFLGVMLVTASSIFVQAYTFRLCLPFAAKQTTLLMLVYAWAAGGITGFVAPLFAGFAMRTAVLKSMGLGIHDSTLATLRQALFNVEYSLFAAAVITLIYPHELLPELGLMLTAFWMLWWLGRRMIRYRTHMLPKRYRPSAAWLLAPPGGRLLFWLFGQLGLMALNYQVAFSGYGVSLELHEFILLASLSVLISVAAMMPNGLGVLEVLWIGIAQHKGLEMSDSVGLALLMRLSYLCSASLLWAGIFLARRDQTSKS